MKRILIFALVAAVVLCVAVFALARPGRRAPTTPVAAEVNRATTVPVPTAIPRGYVSKALLGDAWPLSIDEGTIVCDKTAILLRAPDGQLYAVNGTARGQVGHNGWRDIRDITLPDPKVQGLIMNVQPLVDRGLALCR